jgi:hypothetical protein
VKCFYHNNADAVGSCRSCSRGLCAACAVEFDKGLACPDRCEDDVEASIKMTDTAIKNVANTTRILRMPGQTAFVAGIFNITLGAVFIAWHLSDPVSRFLPIMGGVFVAYGLFSVNRALSIVPSSRKSRKVERHSEGGDAD